MHLDAQGVRRVTETLDLRTDAGRWACNRCGADLGPVGESYKRSCLLYDRDPREIHEPFRGDPEFSYCPDPEWCVIVEVYCPGCGVLMDVEYLPPGHPITHDVQPLAEGLGGGSADGGR